LTLPSLPFIIYSWLSSEHPKRSNAYIPPLGI
jgi:hypothetical protein